MAGRRRGCSRAAEQLRPGRRGGRTRAARRRAEVGDQATQASSSPPSRAAAAPTRGPALALRGEMGPTGVARSGRQRWRDGHSKKGRK